MIQRTFTTQSDRLERQESARSGFSLLELLLALALTAVVSILIGGLVQLFLCSSHSMRSSFLGLLEFSLANGVGLRILGEVLHPSWHVVGPTVPPEQPKGPDHGRPRHLVNLEKTIQALYFVTIGCIVAASTCNSRTGFVLVEQAKT